MKKLLVVLGLVILLSFSTYVLKNFVEPAEPTYQLNSDLLTEPAFQKNPDLLTGPIEPPY
jgi:hypothetical protein